MSHTLLSPSSSAFELQPGELYAGILIGKNGLPNQNIILLPGDAVDVTWKQAQEWAASIGGELPTRREQSLLFANLGEEFKRDWYWSCEAEGAGWAWCQYFLSGSQNCSTQLNEFRARAVRRLPI
jgi:hypothetical protein